MKSTVVTVQSSMNFSVIRILREIEARDFRISKVNISRHLVNFCNLTSNQNSNNNGSQNQFHVKSN